MSHKPQEPMNYKYVIKKQQCRKTDIFGKGEIIAIFKAGNKTRAM
jgi:hypothetical protein